MQLWLCPTIKIVKETPDKQVTLECDNCGYQYEKSFVTDHDFSCTNKKCRKK